MFFDVYSDLCAKKGVSPKKAAVEIGLSNSITTKWKKTQATPSTDTLAKIADYFDVSINYLLERDNDELLAEGELLKLKSPVVGGKPLTEKEQIAVEKLRTLSPEQQEMVYRLLEIEYK